MKYYTNILTCLTLASVAFTPVAGMAEEMLLEAVETEEVISVEFDIAAESDESLSNTRGASGVSFTAETLGVAILSGISTGNTTNGGVTGTNNISGNAFNDSSGFSLVLQNSGNNSVVNAAMVINLSVSQ